MNQGYIVLKGPPCGSLIEPNAGFTPPGMGGTCRFARHGSGLLQAAGDPAGTACGGGPVRPCAGAGRTREESSL